MDGEPATRKIAAAAMAATARGRAKPPLPSSIIAARRRARVSKRVVETRDDRTRRAAFRRRNKVPFEAVLLGPPPAQSDQGTRGISSSDSEGGSEDDDDDDDSKNGDGSRRPRKVRRVETPLTAREREILGAVQVAQELLNRSSTTAAGSKEYFRFGPWQALDMHRLRLAESLMYDNPITMNLIRYLVDSVTGKGVRIEEHEQIYDGAKQERWQTFLDETFMDLLSDVIRHWMCIGYCAITFVPHAEFGFRPVVLKLSEVDHHIQCSGTSVRFRYTPRAHTSGGGGLASTLGESSFDSFAEETRVAYRLNVRGQEPTSAPSETCLAPDPHSDQVVRMKPRILTAMFEANPTPEHGPRSRQLSVMDVLATANYFLASARLLEGRKKMDRAFASRPPLPPANVQAQLGAAMGAAAAITTCPTGVSFSDAQHAGRMAVGAVPFGQMNGGGLGRASLLERRAAMEKERDVDLLRRADAIWMSPSARESISGYLGDTSDDAELAAAARAQASGGRPSIRSFGNTRVYSLDPGEKIEHAPSPAPPGDFVNVWSTWAADLAANAYGVPRILYEHSSTSHSKSTAVGENDPAWKTFYYNRCHVIIKLKQLVRDVYRHCWLPEIASRIPGRTFVPGTLGKRRAEEKAVEREQQTAKRQKSSSTIRQRISDTLRRRVLGAMFRQDRDEADRLLREYRPADAIGGGTPGDGVVPQTQLDNASISESVAETLASYKSLPEFRIPELEARKMLVELAKMLRETMFNASRAASVMDTLFGSKTAITDVEALMRLMHDVEDDEYDREQIVKESTRERILAIDAQPVMPAITTLAGASYIERLKMLRPWAFARIVESELGIPMSDMYATPQDDVVGVGASGGAGSKPVTARGLSRQLAATQRLTVTGPSTRENGLPRMPLVDAGLTKHAGERKPRQRAEAVAAEEKKQSAPQKPAAAARPKPAGKKARDDDKQDDKTAAHGKQRRGAAKKSDERAPTDGPEKKRKQKKKKSKAAKKLAAELGPEEADSDSEHEHESEPGSRVTRAAAAATEAVAAEAAAAEAQREGEPDFGEETPQPDADGDDDDDDSEPGRALEQYAYA